MAVGFHLPFHHFSSHPPPTSADLLDIEFEVMIDKFITVYMLPMKLEDESLKLVCAEKGNSGII